MFFIIGTRPRIEELRMLTMTCWSCTQTAAHRLTRKKNHLTFFFLPIIPLGTSYTLQCLLCGVSQSLAAGAATDILQLPEQVHGTR